MKSKEDLFQLIHAMSKSEKRYFTLDAQKSGRKESKYLELFHSINGMQVYDEEKLKKKFKRNLPSDKAYLYEAVLRSMRDYRSSKSLAARIKELILDAKYLYERGLYHQCEERLGEAKRLAEELDDQLALLEINREMRNLVWDTKKNYDAQIGDLIEDKDKNLKALREEFFYLDLSYQLVAELRKQHDLRDPKRRAQLEKRYPADWFVPERKPSSVHALRRYYQSMALYYNLFGQHDKAMPFYAKITEWWDDNPKYKEEEFYRYFVDVSNLLSIYASRAQYEKLPALLDKLKQTPVSSFHAQGLFFKKIAIYELMYYINTGHSEGVDVLVGAIEKGLNTYPINASSKTVLIFNTAVLLFVCGDFEKCIEWSRKIIRGMKTNSREDIQYGIHLLHLVATFEAGELEEIDSTLRASNRYFFVRNKMSKEGLEFGVLDYIKKLAAAPLGEVSAVYLDMKQYIQELKQGPRGPHPLGLDELVLLWINSKLNGANMNQIIRQGRREAVEG